jgi:predicted nucleotidyltransferase
MRYVKDGREMNTDERAGGLASLDKGLVEDLRRSLLGCAGDRIRSIILYGSRASGNARADSDFDVLVVERPPVAKREERRRLRHALHNFPRSVDVWVMDEEEFDETKNIIGGIAYPANKYGVRLE